MTGGGYALRLRFAAALVGPCMRCLEAAAPSVDVDAREVDQPGGGEELSSPYVTTRCSTSPQWAHDASRWRCPARSCAARTAPACARCAARTSTTDPGHAHERAPDPRWAKLRELRLE